MLASNGKAPWRNGTLVRASTNGSTGRMQGLRIVSTPPKKASTNSIASTSDRDELQREAVDAVAQPRRLRSVLEHVTEMPAAAAAVHGRAYRPETAVVGRGDGVRKRLPEARPTRAAVELHVGREQRLVAAGAVEDALAVLAVQ